ncbi:MAG: D-alanine--D-alanine ligase [Spartobacteria bacterium]|nr:D-alanine--D-alanine ligase [Spartobacteria bacterium]
MSRNTSFHTVGVMMGGPSAEHDISIKSGQAVSEGLRHAGYDVRDIVFDTEEFDIPADVEAVFPVLHGAFGEDGGVQRILEKKGIPYVGSGPRSSREAFDKRASKQCFVANQIATPAFELLSKASERTLPLPVVVKPCLQGSSLGVYIVFNESEWDNAFREAQKYDEVILVETYIPGREFTVALLQGEALPVIEIVAPDGNFDYKAKYTKGMTRYDVPAQVDESLAKAMQSIAMHVNRTLRCKDLNRVDFRMNEADELFVLESNTIPGFTATSLLPMAAGASGISFPELCSRLIQCAACGKY